MSGLNLQELLNPEQLAAATTVDGPILILAGAGSGKTRVITHRIAYLIKEAGVSPENILAVTFTNKAAEEMRERMKKILGAKAAKVQLSTFHSTCARLLRQECELLGMPRNFSIYDSSDQISVIKEVMEDLGIESGDYKPKQFRSAISRSKNNMLTPSDLMKKGGYFNELTAEVLSAYNVILKRSSALDFDDLLLKPLELFRNNEELKTKYRDRYKYLLVDEFQDTNRAQFELLLYLTGEDKNLCVVGDDDQSIYGWRGADISNILNFEKHFPDTKVFKLEQNYRSTKHILGAASSVVKNNKKRKKKKLWTDSAEGKVVTFIKTSDDRSEAAQIQAYMQEEIFNEKRTFKDFAILYRTNAQSRVLEEALRLEGIAYVIVGGVKFYDRKEVKDLLSYLRLISNPNDSASLKRVINYPPRGLGAVTLRKIKDFALSNKLLFWEALERLDEIEIGTKQKKRLTGFRKLIEKYTDLKKELPLEELVRVLDEELGIRKLLKQEGTEESLQREANIRELFNSISEFCEQNPGTDLDGFLENVALVSDIDSLDSAQNAVKLMTLHSSKGLEFPVIFIAGCEDGLLPLIREADLNGESENIEEERRLFYVGMTRAKEKLYLTSAAVRRTYGNFIPSKESPFLSEINKKNIETVQPEYRINQLKSASVSRARKPYRSKKGTADSKYKIVAGNIVSHKLFGKGKVLEVTPDHGDLKLVVDFGEVGTKNLLAGYAKLEVIS